MANLIELAKQNADELLREAYRALIVPVCGAFVQNETLVRTVET